MPPAGEPLDPGTLSAAISGSGFELLRLDLELEGELLEVSAPGAKSQVAVELASTGQRFALVSGASDQARAAWGLLAPELAPEVVSGPGPSGTRLWVRGHAVGRAAGMPALEVSEVRFLEN